MLWLAMTLRFQLLGTIAVVLLGTLLLAAWLTYRHAQNKIETEMVAAIAVGSRIAHNAVDDVEEVVNPRRRLELLVADFDGDRHLKAFIIEPNGATNVQSKLGVDESEAPGWFEKLLRYKSEPVVLPLPEVFDGFGKFALETDAGNEIGEAWSDIQLFAKILAFFCASGVLVTLYILGRALKPLRLLTSAFHQIGTGDYTPRINENGAQELVELAHGFNQMAARLAGVEAANKRLLAHVETVQDEERTELARNLHDEVSPLLFCVDVDAMSIRRIAESANDEVIVGHANAIQRAIDDLKENVKGILGELRPSTLHALSLKDSVDDLVDFWSSRHPGIQIEANVAHNTWGAKIDDAVVSIIREAVSNALKHGSPRNIWINATEVGQTVQLEVRDNGGGLRRPVTEGGFGILGMKERASKLGGDLTVSATRDKAGVVVKASLPQTQDVERALPIQDNFEAVP